MGPNFFIVAGMSIVLLFFLIRGLIRKYRRRSIVLKKSKIVKDGFDLHKIVKEWRCCKKCGQWWHKVGAYKWGVSDATVNDEKCICHTVKDT